MSDVSGGPGWWQASDGKWYRPEQHPNYLPLPPPPPPPPGQAPYPPPGAYLPTPKPQETSGLAIASLVLSILWLGGLGALLAVIFGGMARRQIRQAGGRIGGAGLAIAGFVIGIVGLAGAALFVVLVFAAGVSTTNAVVASCNADAKSVETAVEAYNAQLGTYPPNVQALTQTDTTSINGVQETVGPWLKEVPESSYYTILIGPPNGSVYVYPAGAGTPTSFDPSNKYDGSVNPCNSVS